MKKLCIYKYWTFILHDTLYYIQLIKVNFWKFEIQQHREKVTLSIARNDI
jgi:hypothetical protein